MGISGKFWDELRFVWKHDKLSELERHDGRIVAAWDISGKMHSQGRSVDPVACVLHNDYGRTIRSIVRMLQRMHGCGVEVLSVFDGTSQPHKKDTDADRAELRAKHREELDDIVARKAADGSSVSAKQLHTAAGKCVSRTPQFTAELQAALTAAGFAWEVAPHEADSLSSWQKSVARKRESGELGETGLWSKPTGCWSVPRVYAWSCPTACVGFLNEEVSADE